MEATRRLVLVLLVAAVLMGALSFAGAEALPAPAEALWTIEIVGAEKDEFTSLDYDLLEKVTVDAVLKKKDGSQQQQQWEGVLMKDVLAALGVTGYSSITLEASDAYAKDYTPEIVDDPATILGTVLGGEPLGEEDGFVRSVAASQSGNMWISHLVKITVNP